MFEALKDMTDKRPSLAIIAGFAPVFNFCLMAALSPQDDRPGGQPFWQRAFYTIKAFTKSFLPISIQEPGNWVHPNHPHVELVWPFYNTTGVSQWPAIKIHTIWGTYVPILMGIAVHKLAEHTGLNEALEEHGVPFDI